MPKIGGWVANGNARADYSLGSQRKQQWAFAD